MPLSPACRLLLAGLFWLGSSAQGQTADAAKPPASFTHCANCHGENGVSGSTEIPALAGQNEAYLLDRMQALKRVDGAPDFTLCMLAALDDEQVKMAAVHFARLPYVRKRQSVDPDKAARGQETYLRLCQLCHSDYGRSTVYEEYPLLAWQSLQYLQSTMARMISGQRKIDGMKANMLSLLYPTPERINDALHFFASQEADSATAATPVKERKKLRRRWFKSPQN